MGVPNSMKGAVPNCKLNELPGQGMYSTLISTSALASVREPAWAVVDCRFDLQREDWGHAQYLAGHIPGAVYAHLGTDLSGPMDGRNGRHPWPAPEALAATFGRWGIGADTQVVAYDQDSGMFASRLWYLLRAMGHERVAVLDGGWARWVAEGRPTSGGEETRPQTTFAGSLRPDAVVTAADIERTLGTGATLLVDARAPERFDGSVEPIDPVGGHIPGAVNRPYRQNVGEDGLMRPSAALREEFTRLFGGRPADQTIMYCGSGVSACHNLLALEHAGLSGSRLYPGSWSEWCADKNRPVETGR